MEFRLLGPLEVRRGGSLVPLGPPKERALLGLLLLRANEPVSVRELQERLWPAAAPAGAKRSLQVHVSRLRARLADETGAEPRLSASPAGYVLRVGHNECDVHRFERLLEAGRDALDRGEPGEAAIVLRDALALWRGLPLADLADEPFAQAEIARLAELHEAALTARIEADLQLGRNEQLIPELRALVAREPAHEAHWRQLMLALYRSERQEDALDVYHLARTRLLAERGLEPSPRLRDLERAILNHEIRVADAFAGTASGRLPAVVTPLVGRERELTMVGGLLARRGARLVTLTGPGGIGKTRLAIALALARRGNFADGVFFVDLAPVRAPSLVADAVASAVGMREHRTANVTRALESHLRARECLLVLDNFEHVIAAAPVVAALLAAAQRLSVLVASREPLRLSGEQIVEIAPLAQPTEGETDPAVLADVESVAFFVQRARAVDPGFALTRESAPAVGAICRRLDGLPLALELAAAYAATLSPDEIVMRLDERFELLQDGPRDLPARQQSLRAAIDWSHDLLSNQERRVFARLGVFVNGCTVTSAAAVCDAPRNVVHSLARKSLLRRIGGRETRFTMLETIREYAVARLEESGELADARRRHGRFFAELAANAAPNLRGPEQLEWLRRLDEEEANLRSAFDWALEAGETDLALSLGASLWPYWEARGSIREARERLDDALRAAAAGAPERAGALFATGRIALRQGDLEHAQRSFTESLSLFQRAGDTAGRALSTAGLGWVALSMGEIDEGVTRCREAVELARASEVAWVAADALNNLGTALRLRRDLSEATAALEEALEIRRQIEDLEGVAATLGSLAWVEVAKGEFAVAEALFEEALAVSSRREDVWYATAAHVALAYVALARGDLRRARSLASEGLSASGKLGAVQLAASALRTIAAGEASSGSPQRAALLVGAANERMSAGRRRTNGAARKTFNYGWETAALDSVLTRAQDELGSAEWNRLVDRGHGLSPDDVAELALA